MKKFICFVIIGCWVCLLIVPVFSQGEQSGVSGTDTFVTTCDPTRYSEFVAGGDTIEAHGFYEGDVVAGFELSDAYFSDSSIELKAQPDGSYTAFFTGKPPANFSVIVISFESGSSLKYRIDYAEPNGWYFAEHTGLSNRNNQIIENYDTVRPEVVVQYLVGENSSRSQITETLNRISQLTAEVTAGLDNDYARARAISAWVADNIYYDCLASTTDVNLETVALCNVLENRRGICSGYANLTAAMYEASGLKAVTVIGSALSLGEFDNLFTKNNRHEWMAFWYKEENRWVMLDSGWDSWNRYDENGYVSRLESPRKYFDITPSAFAQSHRAIKAEYRNYFADYGFDGEEVVFPGNYETPGIAYLNNSEDSDNTDSETGTQTTEPDDSEEPETKERTVFPYLIPVLVVVVGILIFGIIHESLY